MNHLNTQVCPCTLDEGFSGYSPAGLRLLYNRKRVSHILNFLPPEIDREVAEMFRQNSQRISISGAQYKQSLVVDKAALRLTHPDEMGHYILKTIPFRAPFRDVEALPANEHLTMQIARQVYGINTAACALVFFQNGQPAYITRRFDYAADGTKIAQEDFASIAGKARNIDGDHFHYRGSYEEIANYMKQHVAAYPIEVGKFFERVVFNYLFCNGDAHLKNFSLQQTPSGDYVLSPAYDLMNTSVHIENDSFFALEDGLYDYDFEADSFMHYGFYTHHAFLAFGLRIGIPEQRAVRMLERYRTFNPQVPNLIQRSFLSPEIKQRYLSLYHTRLKMLNISG